MTGMYPPPLLQVPEIIFFLKTENKVDGRRGNSVVKCFQLRIIGQHLNPPIWHR